jgi:hypothetical protein
MSRRRSLSSLLLNEALGGGESVCRVSPMHLLPHATGKHKQHGTTLRHTQLSCLGTITTHITMPGKRPFPAASVCDGFPHFLWVFKSGLVKRSLSSPPHTHTQQQLLGPSGPKAVYTDWLSEPLLAAAVVTVLWLCHVARSLARSLNTCFAYFSLLLPSLFAHCLRSHSAARPPTDRLSFHMISSDTAAAEHHTHNRHHLLPRWTWVTTGHQVTTTTTHRGQD